MKRRRIFVFTLVLLIIGAYICKSITICTSNDEILDYIAKEKHLEECTALTIVDTIISDDQKRLLTICKLGKPYASRIFAWKFNIIGTKIYIPDSGFANNDESGSIKSFFWDGKAVVVINDSNIKMYTAIMDQQEDTGIIDHFPKVIMFPMETLLELVFYDENFNRINY